MKFDAAKQHLNVEIFIEWYLISCDRCLCLGDGDIYISKLDILTLYGKYFTPMGQPIDY